MILQQIRTVECQPCEISSPNLTKVRTISPGRVLSQLSHPHVVGDPVALIRATCHPPCDMSTPPPARPVLPPSTLPYQPDDPTNYNQYLLFLHSLTHLVNRHPSSLALCRALTSPTRVAAAPAFHHCRFLSFSCCNLEMCALTQTYILLSPPHRYVASEPAPRAGPAPTARPPAGSAVCSRTFS